MTPTILNTTLNTVLAAVATLAAGAVVIYVATQVGRHCNHCATYRVRSKL
jgi:hypothetical protein